MKALVTSIVLLATVVGGEALAQGYPMYSTSQTYVPLSGAGVTTVALGDKDDGAAKIVLGFSFPYYGHTFTEVYANTNGMLVLPSGAPPFDCDGSSFNSNCFKNELGGPFPSASRGFHDVIAPWWDDLDGSNSTSAIRYFKPNASEIVIEWTDWNYFLGSAKFGMQVRLSASGMIKIHYGTHSGSGNGGSSAGFENGTGSAGDNVLACTPNCTATDWPANTLVTIGQPTQPDLVVESVTLAGITEGASSLSFDVSATFRNVGQNAANNFQWKAYLSTDRVKGAGDPVIFTSSTPLSAAGGSTASENANVVISPQPAPGQYYVLVEADATGAVTEASEDNNVGSTSSHFTYGIDLVANAVSGPSAARPGVTLPINLKFKNDGSRPVTAVPYKVYLSTDPELNAGDFMLASGTRDVAAGEVVDENISVNVPGNVPGGELFYLLEVDAGNATPEANENNNAVASAEKVKVDQADLVIDSVELVDVATEAPVQVGFFGQVARVRVKMHNAGGADASNFKVGVAISYDSNLSLLSDTVVHDEPVASLAAGASQTVSFTFPLPLKDKANRNFTTGNYFLFGMLDSFAQVSELVETNNNLAAPGQVNLRAPAQDYTVTKLVVPASAAVGEVVPVLRTLKNVGTVDGTAVSYRYYASANDIITPDDVPLAILGANGASNEAGTITLASGADDSATEFVKLPPSMPAGTYYVGCIVDSANAASELDEQNNAVASLTTMQVAPPALRVATDQLPDGVVDRPYYFRLVAVGGAEPASWALDPNGGDLPNGLSLAADGSITGTPTATAVHAFTVVAQSGDRAASARLVLRVLPTTSELEITTVALPPVVASTAVRYQASLGAAGGLGPYRWRVADGALPAGITLDAEGQLSGAVRAGVGVGESRVTFEVVDSVGTRATASLRVRVVEPGALIIGNLVVPDAMVHGDYLVDLSAANLDNAPLARPLSWSVVSGALPDGLVLSVENGERGLISGKPLVAGNYTFTLQVEDAKGRADTADFILRVHAVRFRLAAVNPPAIVHPGDEVSFAFTSGSTQPSSVHFRLFSGNLPPGLSLGSDGLVTGTVEMESSVGVYNFVVEARDASGQSGLGAFTLEVTPVPRNVGCNAAPSGGALTALALLFAPLLFRRRRHAGLAALGAAALVCLPTVASAQGFSYQRVGPVAATYQPMNGGTVLDDVYSWSGESLSIPFPFKFYGQTHSVVTVAMHGYIVFSGDSAAEDNLPIPHAEPSGNPPLTFIAPWWDSLWKSSTSTVQQIKYQVTGTTPNRVLTIEWKNVEHYDDIASKHFSFQVKLYETTGQIRFAYGSSTPGLATASVGLMKTTNEGTAGLVCTSPAGGNCSPSDFPANQAIDFFLPADLVLSGLSGDQVGYAGVAFRSAVTVRNQGGRAATNAKVRFYLSSDVNLDSGDVHLGEGSVTDLGTGQEQLVSASAQIPSGTAAGNYFLLAKADPDNLLTEMEEGNNLAVPISVKVGPPTADLQVTSISGPTQAQPGDTVTIARVITNGGNAAAGAFKFTYFLSDNAAVTISDRALSSAGTVASLAAGASDTKTESVSLPGDLGPGKYWVGVCVDYEPSGNPTGAVQEISEVNNCATASAAVVVNTGALAVITTSLPGISQYSPFGLTLQASGGTGAYAWALTGGQLPTGVTLNADGQLGGTPSVAGSFSFDVKVTSGGAEASATLSLQVTPASLPLAVVDQELPAAEFARPYAAKLVAVGGKPPYVWSLTPDGRLPIGLALASDGHIEGRASESGQFPFSVEIEDSAGTRAAKDLRIRVVNPTSMHIATSRLSTGYLEKEYLQILQAVGGKAPYTWQVVGFQQLAENETDEPGPIESALPESFGLRMESDVSGQTTLTGAPMRAGLFAVTFRVQDATGSEDITTLPLTITYDQALAITTTVLPDAFVGHTYNARILHNGGAAATDVRFSVPCVKQVQPNLTDYGCAPVDVVQTLPAGLLLSPDGQLSGTPLPPQTPLATGADGKPQPVTFSFLIKVTDGAGRQDVRGLSIKVRPDYDLQSSGCSATALAPSALALLAAAGLLRRRRR